MFSNSAPLISRSICTSSQPIFSATEFNKSFATTNLRSFAFTTTYVKSGFTEIPKFAGNVQGVVVQITISSSLFKTPLPSSTLNATKIDGDLMSLYSISASANADSEEGDQ